MWFIYAVVASILWGLNYALDEKILHSKVSAFTLLSLQMIFGAFIFSVLSILSKNFKTDINILIADRPLFWIILVTVIVTILANLLIVLSIQAQNATVTTLIELSYPLITIFFSWILFRESHLNTGIIVGGILIIIGATLTIIFSSNF